MKRKTLGMNIAGWILAGGSPANATLEEELMDESIDIKMPVHDNPNFPRKISTPNYPKINLVPGNKVKGDGKANYLAWANYDTRSIDLAAFDEIMEEAKGKAREVYGHVRDALHRYILNHERLELEYQPQTHIQHGAMEARNLDILESTDPDAYTAGLAHLKRLRDGDRDGKAFYKATSRHYDLGKAFKKYGAELDEMVGLVSDVISGKPTYRYQADSGPSYAADEAPSYRIEDYRTPMELSEAA